MARFSIYSASGVKKYEGTPSYTDSYLKTDFLEFREISSPTPIEWEIGDYVDYSRTGLRYKLYTIPVQTVKKQARNGSYGAAFVYQNVQFFSPAKMLELAPFRDLVRGDNTIHFSTQNSISVWDDVYGIAERIEVCLNDMFPNQWAVNVVETSDAKLLETLTTELNYTVEGVSCLGALEKIYELWDNIGWIYSYASGKHIITVGAADVRTASNTAPELTYGKGHGLVTLERSISNRDAMATRLYVYGSNRNMMSRYYNNLPLDIKEKESVDIQHLMLPVTPIASLSWGGWGKTSGKYDASKAYIENADAISKYGLIVKSAYLDGTDGDDIYPSLKGMTIGEIRTALGSSTAKYYPRENVYTNPEERVDLIKSALNPFDSGMTSEDGSKYAYQETKRIAAIDDTPVTGGISFSHIIVESGQTVGVSGKATLLFNNGGYIHAPEMLAAGYAIKLQVTSGTGKVMSFDIDANVESDSAGGYYYRFSLPEVTLSDSSFASSFTAVLTGSGFEMSSHEEFTLHLDEGSVEIGYENNRSDTFKITLKQIGFDINDRAALGEGKATIAMTSGMCVGRSFLVKSCSYDLTSDSWILTCWRQADNSIGMWYPNKDFQIASGDSFVMLDIAMPEIYINAAMQKLLVAGRNLLAEMSSPQPVFTPKVDAKYIREYQDAHGTELSPLRSGTYLHINDSEIDAFGNDYVLIDTVTINEGESNIPTYSITLREKKKVTIKESYNASSSDMSSSVKSSGTTTQQTASGGGIDLSEVWNSLKNNTDDFANQTINTAHIPQLDISKISNISSASVDNAAKLGGVSAAFYATQSWVENKGYRAGTAPASGSWWRGTPIVNTDGVMEVGKYIDFHHANVSTADYSVRFACPDTTGVTITLPSTTGTLALASDIPSLVGYATQSWVEGKGYQLASTAITTSNIGSQSVAYATNAGSLGGIASANYYHSGNSNKSDVDWTAGKLTANTIELKSAAIKLITGPHGETIDDYLNVHLTASSGSWAVINGVDSYSNPLLLVNRANGYIGVGTSSPSYPLDIAGTNSVCLNMTSTGTQTSMQLSRSATNLWQISHRGTGESNALKFYHFNGSSWNNALSISADGNVTALGEITAYSDRRLKSNIKALSFRGRLAPKTYIKDGKESIGFIAQEVAERYPELVLGKEGKDSYLSLNYGAISAVLSAQLNETDDRVARLEEEVAILKARIKVLEAG